MNLKLRWPWRKIERHPAVTRNLEFFANFDQARPIESYDIVSLDTELTGLSPRRDEIVSIGAVRIKNLKIVVGENFFCYVRPSGDLPKFSTLIHRITPEQISDAPTLKEVLPDFVEFCGDSLLLGHFLELDMAFLNRACRKLLGGMMRNPGIDSMRLAQVFQEQEWRSGHREPNPNVSYNLTALARKYELPLFEKHDALEDALQTAYLFLFLATKLQQAGHSTLKDFYLSHPRRVLTL